MRCVLSVLANWFPCSACKANTTRNIAEISTGIKKNLAGIGSVLVERNLSIYIYMNILFKADMNRDF